MLLLADNLASSASAWDDHLGVNEMLSCFVLRSDSSSLRISLPMRESKSSWTPKEQSEKSVPGAIEMKPRS